MYGAELWMISKCEVVMLESMHVYCRFLGLSEDCQLAVIPLLPIMALPGEQLVKNMMTQKM